MDDWALSSHADADRVPRDYSRFSDDQRNSNGASELGRTLRKQEASFGAIPRTIRSSVRCRSEQSTRGQPSWLKARLELANRRF